jgi:hypothetical protein
MPDAGRCPKGVQPDSDLRSTRIGPATVGRHPAILAYHHLVGFTTKMRQVHLWTGRCRNLAVANQIIDKCARPLKIDVGMPYTKAAGFEIQ